MLDTTEVLLLVTDEVLGAGDDTRALDGFDSLVRDDSGKERVSTSCQGPVKNFVMYQQQRDCLPISQLRPAAGARIMFIPGARATLTPRPRNLKKALEVQVSAWYPSRTRLRLTLRRCRVRASTSVPCRRWPPQRFLGHTKVSHIISEEFEGVNVPAGNADVFVGLAVRTITERGQSAWAPKSTPGLCSPPIGPSFKQIPGKFLYTNVS